MAELTELLKWEQDGVTWKDDKGDPQRVAPSGEQPDFKGDTSLLEPLVDSMRRVGGFRFHAHNRSGQWVVNFEAYGQAFTAADTKLGTASVVAARKAMRSLA